VLIANAAWAAWRILVLLISWYVSSLSLKTRGLKIRPGSVSGHGCVGLCWLCTRFGEAEIGRTPSIYSEMSEVGSTGTGGGAEMLPWVWKTCILLCMLEAYEFYHTLRRPRTTQTTMAGQPSEGGFEGIKKVFAAVGLGTAT
jgi:hypothetical protein